MVHDLAGGAFVEEAKYLKGERRAFYLSPNRWASSAVTTPLQWKEVKFESGNKTRVPKQRGIYAFVVKHVNDHFPPHGFIMYIGITGHSNSKRTLRDRFGDYLREKARNKRPKVHFMLNAYEHNLFFTYVPIPNAGPDLVQLELDLNTAIIPPVSRKDLSAELKALRDALE